MPRRFAIATVGSSAALFGQSRLHRRAVEVLQDVRHALHPARHHVFDRGPAREWRALNLPVQPGLIFAGRRGRLDLRQIGRDPLLARGEPEAGALLQVNVSMGPPDEASLRLSPRANIGIALCVIGGAHFFALQFDPAEQALLLRDPG